MPLEVWLYGTQVGTLDGSSWRDFDFRASDEGAARFGVLSTVLSEAVPLAVRAPRGQAARRRNFFHELLPEGATRSALARQARVDEADTLGLLRRYGRDVAGALEVFDPDDPWEPPTPSLRPLDDSAVRRLAEMSSTEPLGNDPGEGRISLGGVQLKLALTRSGNQWCQPLGGLASTHILKQPSARHTTMIFDEEFGARLARGLGLLDYDVHVDDFNGLPMLVVERYDRALGRRLHQEDMNQALGLSGSQKYQRYGGGAKLSRIAQVIAWQGRADGVALLRLVTFAAGLGNLDLHAKNISLLHMPDGTTRLAPAYDNVPLLHQPTDGELAMAVDDVYRLADLHADSLVREGAAWGLGDQSTVVSDVLTQMRQGVDQNEPLPGAFPGLRESIADNIDRLLS